MAIILSNKMGAIKYGIVTALQIYLQDLGNKQSVFSPQGKVNFSEQTHFFVGKFFDESITWKNLKKIMYFAVKFKKTV